MLIKLHRFNTAIMRNFKLVILFFLSFKTFIYGQYNGLGFSYPLAGAIVVTGNYGEIRPNHFHAGLDFSTDPILNLPIKCVADGYISRIKISGSGYGKVLYVTHPNGYVTVYAHQKKYADRIDAYVKQKQLEQKKNDIELFPAQSELSIKKGELIGYTGNSGSSTGPHLHFEIREEKTEIPLNPLLIYDVKDNIKPEITHLAIFNTSDTNAIVTQTVVTYNRKLTKLNTFKNVFVLPQNTFAVGFAGYDLSNGSTNKNIIYEAKLTLDGQLIYHHQLNRISFDEARYVNVFSEKAGNVKLQKCFTPTCYNFSIYKTLVNGGKIELKDTLPHTMVLTVYDEKGNSGSVTYNVRAKTITGYRGFMPKNNAFCNEEFIIKQNNFEMVIPVGSLVYNTFIHQRTYIKAPIGGGIDIGNKTDKVIKPYKMALKISNPLKELESKLVMTVNGEIIGGKFENGWLRAEPKAFGNYNYMYDTVAPVITYASKKLPVNMSAGKSVSFKVTDAGSGVGEYAVYINTIWQIAEYDAKSSTITCYFDDATPKGTITINVEVPDKVGNKGTFEMKTLR